MTQKEGGWTVGADEPSRLRVCVVTFLDSPYQVELFNEIAAAGEVSLQVVYLHDRHRNHPWLPVPCQHDHIFIQWSGGAIRTAWQWAKEADVTIFNYYTHWFALPALYARHLSGKPWAFWGEEPGFLKLGWLGRLGRRLLLHPLAVSDAPIMAVGRVGLAGYQRDWGDEKTYINFPYFSDLARFADVDRRSPRATTSILFSGVLNARKGVLELALAFKKAAREFPHLRLIILGAGPLEEAMRSVLQPVADRVKWAGFRQWNELPECYADADVLCLPTRHDGWGMVVPEGLAAGLPVLTTEASGAAIELIEPGVNGWRLPGNKVPILLEGLRVIGKLNRQELATMCEAARRSVASHSLENGAARFAAAAWEALRLFHCRPASRGETEQASAPSKLLLIAGTYAPDRLSSMRRYVSLVEQAARGFDGEVRRIDPPVVCGGRRPAPLKKILGYLDKYALFPAWLRWKACRADAAGREVVIHVTDQGMAIVAHWLWDFPLVVTCHDLIAVRTALGELKTSNRSPRRPTTLQRWIHRGLRLPSVMVCVSQKTLADCRRLLGAQHRYRVVMNPVDPEFGACPEGLTKRDPMLPDAFLLHVGNSLWYKNRPAVLRIYGELRKLHDSAPMLVMLGDPPTRFELELAQSAGIESHVRWIPRPPGDLIKCAYQTAVALIFPSLEEGFGWPVLEAMSCGCPVFASNRPPLTEVGGDAVDYIDPNDAPSAAQLIASCLRQGQAWHSDRAAKGKLRAKWFSLDVFAESMLDAYREAIGYYRSWERCGEEE